MKIRYIVVVMNLFILTYYSVYNQLYVSQQELARGIAQLSCVGLHFLVCLLVGIAFGLYGKKEVEKGIAISIALILLIGIGVCFIP